jgi:uncharacterized protein YfcZ (UPF0381/DUF406 family)
LVLHHSEKKPAATKIYTYRKKAKAVSSGEHIQTKIQEENDPCHLLALLAIGTYKDIVIGFVDVPSKEGGQ